MLGMVSSYEHNALVLSALLNKSKEGRKPSEYSAFLLISNGRCKVAVLKSNISAIQHSKPESGADRMLKQSIPNSGENFAVPSLSVPNITNRQIFYQHDVVLPL
tara:strand:- start:32 stop:343 length:312 start_codon:yes stop_codon:yes gene_type:complete